MKAQIFTIVFFIFCVIFFKFIIIIGTKEKHPSSHIKIILHNQNNICDDTLFRKRGQRGTKNELSLRGAASNEVRDRRGNPEKKVGIIAILDCFAHEKPAIF